MKKTQKENTIPLAQKLFYQIALISVILGIGLTLYVYYLFFWPIRTIEIKNNPVPVLTPKIHPGEPLIYKVSFCKYTDLKATVARSLVDHLVILLPNTTSEFGQGCETRDFILETSANLLPGEYKLVSTFKYQTNPLREIDTTFETQEFEVVK